MWLTNVQHWSLILYLCVYTDMIYAFKNNNNFCAYEKKLLPLNLYITFLKESLTNGHRGLLNLHVNFSAEALSKTF